MGRYLLHYQQRRWFPVKQQSLQRSQSWFQRYGKWSLLLAWAPVIGDALTFIAGMMRVRFDLFFALTAIGKGIRYAVILGLFGLFGS
jgi:membrane protein YqaA with SNARE-associated domain